MFSAVALEAPANPVKEKAPAKPRVKRKNDPKLVATARELRHRWLEHVNTGAYALEARGAPCNYDVSRQLPAARIQSSP